MEDSRVNSRFNLSLPVPWYFRGKQRNVFAVLSIPEKLLVPSALKQIGKRSRRMRMNELKEDSSRGDRSLW